MVSISYERLLNCLRLLENHLLNKQMAFLFPFPRHYPSLFDRRLARDLLLLGLATQREGERDRLLVCRSLDHKPPGPGRGEEINVNKESDHKAERKYGKHAHTQTEKKTRTNQQQQQITIFAPTLMKNILTSLGISQLLITFSLFLKTSLAAYPFI